MNHIDKTGSPSAQLFLGDEIVARIGQLGLISETADRLTRVYLTREHRAAAHLILSWMESAGMRAHLDAVGNVCGRYEGEQSGLPCLMLGSHYDTVRDAGRWDGPQEHVEIADVDAGARVLLRLIEKFRPCGSGQVT